MKKIHLVLILLIFAVFTGSLLIFNSSIINMYWTMREFVEPNLSGRLEKEWNEKTSEFLIKNLKSKVFLYSGTAASILVERREKKALPVLWDLTKSDDRQKRISAFTAIGRINDFSSIEPLMKIVKAGYNDFNYIYALTALSYMKYMPAIEYVVALAKSNPADLKYNDRSHAINMIERYRNKELLPLLEIIAANDEDEFVRYKARETMERLKEEM